MGGVSPRCSTCGHEVFHLWAHNHGFHGTTMESMERTSTSPLWGLVAAAQGSGGRWVPTSSRNSMEGEAMGELALTGDKLVVAIRREHEAASAAARSALEHSLECGRLLAQARAEIPHGGWEH